MNTLHSVSYTNATDDTATGNDPYDDNWLFMEQEYFPPAKQYADFLDAQNMLRRAQSGLSAQSYIADACAVDVRKEGDTFVVPLEFYVFVPADDFSYNLTTNVAEDFSEEDLIKGTITDEGVYLVDKGYTTAFTMTDRIQFNHRLSSLSYHWESPVYDVWGRRIWGPSTNRVREAVSLEDIQELIDSGVHFTTSPAQLAARGRFIVAGADIFGVVRLKYKAIAKRHMLELRLQAQANEEFKNIKPTIVAAWDYAGETHTETLTLDIPQCVYDALAVCGDRYDEIVLFNTNQYIVYYSTCDGSFLTARDKGSLE